MDKIREMLKQLHPEHDYEASDDFISDNLIDSIDLQELFAMIEDEFDIELAGTDLTPQNFRNLDSIRELLADHDVELDD